MAQASSVLSTLLGNGSSSSSSEPSFFSKIFAGDGLKHSVLPEAARQSLKLIPFSIIAVVLNWIDFHLSADIMMPISTLVGLMVALRVTDAYNAWVKANRLLSSLTACAMELMQQSDVQQAGGREEGTSRDEPADKGGKKAAGTELL